jgi:hypothetical protein
VPSRTPLQAAEWLERVQSLAPLVERYRDAGERERRLPNRLERCFRDVHVVRQHAVVSLAGIMQAGRHFPRLGMLPR